MGNIDNMEISTTVQKSLAVGEELYHRGAKSLRTVLDTELGWALYP